MQVIKSTTDKIGNGPALQAILMAMRIRRYGDEHITQYGRSMATLDATGRRHRASIHPVSPQQTPWSSILAYKIELWCCGNRFPKLALKHTKQTLYSASSQLSSYQMLTTDKNSRSDQSPKKLVQKLAAMTANSCWAVNSLTAIRVPAGTKNSRPVGFLQ